MSDYCRQFLFVEFSIARELLTRALVNSDGPCLRQLNDHFAEEQRRSVSASMLRRGGVLLPNAIDTHSLRAVFKTCLVSRWHLGTCTSFGECLHFIIKCIS